VRIEHRLALPMADIGLAPGWAHDRATADAIFAHVRRNLASYQRIRRIEFAELPKTISGEIRRVDLRARENTRTPSDLANKIATGKPVLMSRRRPPGPRGPTGSNGAWPSVASKPTGGQLEITPTRDP
jgi:hypothetical protein